MNDWAFGFATGIAVGLTIDLSFSRRQKPWSELSGREKKVMIWLIAAGVVLLLAGIVVFFLVDKQL
jgi:type II secretory pathway component PulM